MAYRRVGVSLFIFSATFWTMARVAAQDSAQSSRVTPVVVPLEIVSAIQVHSLPSQSLALPILCSPEGTILLRLATLDGVQDPVSVSSDGKTITRFGRDKITDVPRPVPLDVFLSGYDVYMLTLGQIAPGHETQWQTPSGELKHQQASTRSTFIAHFRSDGTYASAIAVTVPFKPLHLGVFADGEFLIAGADHKTDEPRVALVSSRGQFLRFVELEGDVHARRESDQPLKSKVDDPAALPHFAPGEGFGKSLIDVVYGSQIIRDGPNLLLFRPSDGPVFSISPGGEVRTQKLQVRGAYTLETIKRTRDAWIAEFTRDRHDGTGDEFATYAFDPDSGAALREYVYPRDLGFGLACTDGVEFTFVMADVENKSLKLLKLAPASRPRPD